MMILTTETVAGYEVVEVLGLVRGNTVQSRNFFSQSFAGFKVLVGGEIKGYTELLNRVRDQALARLQEHAEQLNADAVIMVRLEASDCLPGTIEMLVYGTAVKLKKISK